MGKQTSKSAPASASDAAGAPALASSPLSVEPDAESSNPFTALDDGPKEPAPDATPPNAAPPEPLDTPPAPVEPKAPAPAARRPLPKEADKSEAERLRDEVAELRVLVAEMRQKNAPAPPPKPKDALSSAKSFGVLATWTGKGSYGGRYFTVRGEPVDGCTGPTTGYFPAACVERFDEFKKVE